MEEKFLAFLHQTLMSAETTQSQAEAFQRIFSAHLARLKYLEQPSENNLQELQELTNFRKKVEEGIPSREVYHNDLVKVVLQFLKDTGYQRTFETLQDESRVNWKAVESLDTLKEHIHKGHWDLFLEGVSSLRVSYDYLFYLYEVVYLELIDNKANKQALSLLSSKVLQKMKKKEPGRYQSLESLLNSPENVWGEHSLEYRKSVLVAKLDQYFEEVPPKRLLTIASQALKYLNIQKKLPNTKAFDLFLGKEVTQEFLGRTECKLRLDPEAQIISLTANENSVVTGSQDGIIEVWDPYTGKLKHSLVYQANGNFMVHEEAVTALECFEKYLAAGTLTGELGLWDLETGQSQISTQLEGKVGCVEFTSTCLVATVSEVIYILSIRDLSLLGTLKGHSEEITCISAEGDLLVSGESQVLLWDLKSFFCKQNIGSFSGVLAVGFTDFNIVTVTTEKASILTQNLHEVLNIEPSERITSAQVSHQLVFLATQNTLKIYNGQGTLLKVLKTEELLTKLSFRQNTLVSLSESHNVSVWT